MKRLTVLLVVVLLCATFASPAAAAGPACATIRSGDIVYPAGHYWAGQSVSRGFDAYGFNYPLHRFSGWFVNSWLGFWGLPPYEGDYDAYIAANPDAAALGDPSDPASFWALKDLNLVIQWNDTYRSDTDCDGDGWFDRHSGFDTYVGSEAWYTNRVQGTFAGEDMTTFSKVMAVPDDAVLTNGMWYTSDGQEFGYAVGDAAIGMAGVFDWMQGPGVLYQGAGWEPRWQIRTGPRDWPGMGGWRGPRVPDGSRWSVPSNRRR